MATVLVICAFIVFIFMLIGSPEDEKSKREEQKIIDKENAKYEKVREELDKRIVEFNALNKAWDEKFGRRTWAIPYRENGSDGSLRVYNDHKLLILDHTKVIRYDEIKSCQYEISDYAPRLVSKTPHFQTATKTDTSSMLIRAAVGGVVAGPVGAIIGGVTAKKKLKN